MFGFIDHIGLSVSDIQKARVFYEATLAPLNASVVMEFAPEQTGSGHSHIGFGREGKPSFWITDQKTATQGLHIAFDAKTRSMVDAFYAAAIKAGGKDNGAPGLRSHYHPNYYGAFVMDPDGNNIEAVCRLPE